ncbi:MAG: 6-phosphofructokinase [Deltaproteobacteria bacterium]|nr:MAG: 6-phosphofructokinase [Deltaproteobacteria bacterium]
MNAAVRAVVRTALDRGANVFTILEGYQGMVDGGDAIRRASWSDVSSILERGGTVLGTARCKAFRNREGRREAVLNMLERGIDRLVVIGGDGSLTGGHALQREWPGLVGELTAEGAISPQIAARHPRLRLVGLVGSIDNDMAGTDTTIGADTALHRITEALDALSSTAMSHRRSFVVEVMGRNCGYLALMSAVSSGADWVFVPEDPPSAETWRDDLIAHLSASRAAGRQNTVVIVAEGARDDLGQPITSAEVRDLIETTLNTEARVTVLGHVQRGGPPSAFDRNLGTLLGHAAVDALLNDESPVDAPIIIGMRGNRIVRLPLDDSLAQNRAVTEAIDAKDYKRAMSLRGGGFRAAHAVLKTLTQSQPDTLANGNKPLRLAVLNAGAPAPGMNAAVRAAVRLGLDRGHVILGVENGFEGLAAGKLKELGWMDVTGWATRGGSELGTRRMSLQGKDLYNVSRAVEEHEIDGILVIGGMSGFMAAHKLVAEREDYPALNIPIVCLPATINNNLPGSELSIGADTALNSIVGAVDKIRQSASAQQRCFVVEVMGRRCGYLATMAGLATGAERAYIHEEGVTISDMMGDLELLRRGFQAGRRLGLIIRSERANDVYDARFMQQLLEEEGGDLFDVRVAILGHLQQGGQPSPFDRISATRFASSCMEFLIEHARAKDPAAAYIGLEGGETRFHDLTNLPRMVDVANQRPKQQWWMALRHVARQLARVESGTTPRPDGDDA